MEESCRVKLKLQGWGSGPILGGGGRAFCAVTSKLSPQAQQSLPNLELQIPSDFQTGPDPVQSFVKIGKFLGWSRL